MSIFKDVCFTTFRHETGNEVVLIGKNDESVVLNAEEAMWLISELTMWINKNYVM